MLTRCPRGQLVSSLKVGALPNELLHLRLPVAAARSEGVLGGDPTAGAGSTELPDDGVFLLIVLPRPAVVAGPLAPHPGQIHRAKHETDFVSFLTDTRSVLIKAKNMQIEKTIKKKLKLNKINKLTEKHDLKKNMRLWMRL